MYIQIMVILTSIIHFDIINVNINTDRRQIRDTVAWVFSEPMLHYYIQLFTKSWWPNGQLVSETVPRTDEEKLKTRGEARRQFLNNVPEVLTNLVGAQSAQRGATKVFDSLQNVNLNKQLFYVSSWSEPAVPLTSRRRFSPLLRSYIPLFVCRTYLKC